MTLTLINFPNYEIEVTQEGREDCGTSKNCQDAWRNECLLVIYPRTTRCVNRTKDLHNSNELIGRTPLPEVRSKKSEIRSRLCTKLQLDSHFLLSSDTIFLSSSFCCLYSRFHQLSDLDCSKRHSMPISCSMVLG